MRASLLIANLQQLAEEERNLFRRFVASPYFNTNPKLCQLLHWLLDHLDTPELTREGAHEAIFPGEAFHYDRITNHLSYLQRLLERFLAQQAWEAEPAERMRWTQQAALERGLDRLWKKVDGKRQRHLQRHPIALEQQLLMTQEIMQQRFTLHLQRGERRPDHSLLQRLEALQDHQALATLTSLCQWHNLQQVVGADTPTLIQDLTDRLNAQPPRPDAPPLIRAYRLVWELLQQPESTAAYEALEAFLEQGAPNLRPEEQKPLYQYLQNACIQRINRGQTQFLEKLLQLYQHLLQTELLYNRGQLSPSDLKNIVSLGVRLKRYEWVRSLLEEVPERISNNQREPLLRYNRAYLMLAEGDLRGALQQLRGVTFGDVYYELGAKVILMKVYYELEDLEGLEATLHAFDSWLRRNRQISAYQRQVHLNLIRFLRKLSKLRAQRPLLAPKAYARKHARLQQRMEQVGEITNLTWLREAIAREAPEAISPP